MLPMTAAIAQIITLTAYGNCYLKTGKLPNSFYLNPTFDSCNTTNFIESKKPEQNNIAHHPGEWFIYLKENGCKELRLYFMHSKDQLIAKDHQLAGFVCNGGGWLIEAAYDTYSDYWNNEWEVTDAEAPDNKIWSVNYIRIATQQKSTKQQYDVTATKNKFEKVLADITTFATAHKLTNWAQLFTEAKEVLNNEQPGSNYLPEKNYSITAKQLVYAASAAWVFGGMGSWNDLGFSSTKDNAQYNKLSEQLYDIINEAIVAAVNSYE